MSYTYDALGRIVTQRTSHGVTIKTYNTNEESVTNILGYTTKIPMMHDEISYKSQKMMDKKISSRLIPTMHWVVQYASEILSEIFVLGTMMLLVVSLMHRIFMLQWMIPLLFDHIGMILLVVS